MTDNQVYSFIIVSCKSKLEAAKSKGAAVQFRMPIFFWMFLQEAKLDTALIDVFD